ncbi:LysR family transcriptional regulator [Nonomuraea typhae]|uniref:LysR family transcriptional regulator n=1 Tax=Nonomuraea typhae TaxID=2603600 RepID=UPI0012F72E7C|nr:LysR family transcriptional regulator [Nonomuraea typhae]
MDLDLGAVRAFVAIAEEHSFSEAAARLGISQQAVSKRIAKLESDLGLTLFDRARGTTLTPDGAALLPPARSLLALADQTLEQVRRRRRALRVDVLDTRLASIDLIRGFHESTAGVDLEIVTSNGLRSARENLARGGVDAVLARALGTLPDTAEALPAYLEPLHVLAAKNHPLAHGRHVETAALAGLVAWMPGNEDGSEWADFYVEMSAAFGFAIDTSGPDFGWEHFVQTVATENRFSFVGEGTRLPPHPDVVRLPVVNPIPAYPWSLLAPRHHRRPVLEALAAYVRDAFQPLDPSRQWVPDLDRVVFASP